jgi:uncharacterized protein
VANRTRIPPQSGVGFPLPIGSTLRVIDPAGVQVADLFAFQAGDLGHWLCSGRSIDLASRIWLTTGDILYSNRSEPMLEIVSDTVGRHDFLLDPCSQETFDLSYQGWSGYHPSCLENLANGLARFGVHRDMIGTTFNIFMNVIIGPAGEILIQPPLSQAGDSIEFQAKMDLIVGLTTCSAEKTNNSSFKPIDFEINPPACC